MSAIACLPTTAEMQATARMKANRKANTEVTQTKIVKPATAWKGTNYSSDTFNIRDDSSSRTARIRQ
jgi:hypothetical protein